MGTVVDQNKRRSMFAGTSIFNKEPPRQGRMQFVLQLIGI
jgi:hypothetical protein